MFQYWQWVSEQMSEEAGGFTLQYIKVKFHITTVLRESVPIGSGSVIGLWESEWVSECVSECVVGGWVSNWLSNGEGLCEWACFISCTNEFVNIRVHTGELPYHYNLES